MVWALVVVIVVWVGFLGAISSLITRLSGWYSLVPLSRDAIEYGAGQTPFGGFPWLWLGYTTTDQPLTG